MGVINLEGLGTPQNFKEALRLFRLSAKQGVAEAQFALGAMYEQGQGVPQDYEEAVKWWRLAAEQKLEVAQYNLEYLHPNLNIYN